MSKTSNYKMTAICGRPFPDSRAFARHATAILGDMAEKLKTTENIPLSKISELLRTGKKRENYPDEQSFLSDQTFSAITFEKNIGVEDVSYAQRSGEDTCFITANGDGEAYDKQRYEIIRYLFSDPSFISAFKQDSTYYWDQNNRQFRHTDEDYNIPLCTKYYGALYYRPDPYPDWPIIAGSLPTPIPLNQEYDISQNPGYFEFHQTYLEEISATMWLGKEFWPRTGADREAVKAADWLQTEEMEHGILKVVAWEYPFNSDEEPQRSVQFNLRKLLFPKAIAERKQRVIDRKKKAAEFLQDYYENGSPPVAPNEATIEEILWTFLPDESYKEALKSDKFRKPDGTPDYEAIVEKCYSIRHQNKNK